MYKGVLLVLSVCVSDKPKRLGALGDKVHFFRRSNFIHKNYLEYLRKPRWHFGESTCPIESVEFTQI